MGRWDRWHEARTVTGEVLLAEEVVKTLVEDLGRWPPPIEGGFADDARRARVAPVLEGRVPRPSAAVYRAAFQLARWELERSFEALDDFARNDRASAVAADRDERTALEFLHGWLTELAHELLEVTPLRRPKLAECLTRAEHRLLG